MLGLAVLLIVIGGIATSSLLELAGIPPRLWAPYVEKRSSGHNPTIVAIGQQVGHMLRLNDRGEKELLLPESFRIGAQPEPANSADAGSVIIVATVAEANAAFARAMPGDVITFAPGKYHFTGKYIDVNRPGFKERRIVVRAAQPSTVLLDFEMEEGFLVRAPYWTFENLQITGTCDRHYFCEHAFHVVGKGDHLVVRNNTIVDFNSHMKINATDGVAPTEGRIEANTLTNNSIRASGNPVNVIDLVVASKWMIRKNLITDFFKGDGNRTSYGGFAKGGGSENVFENNMILCEYKLRAPGAISIGLSLGGGGTGAEYCADKRCVFEQESSIIRGNLIAFCSDDGIYLNKAAKSKISHNTLIDTGGISVRYPVSSADVEGNLVDGKIRSRDNAILRMTDNVDTSVTRLAAGSHPVRDLFKAAKKLDLSGDVPHRGSSIQSDTPDLCDSTLTGPTTLTAHAAPPYGAFADFNRCRRETSAAFKQATVPTPKINLE